MFHLCNANTKLAATETTLGMAAPPRPPLPTAAVTEAPFNCPVVPELQNRATKGALEGSFAVRQVSWLGGLCTVGQTERADPRGGWGLVGSCVGVCPKP